jgi:hypothetical protein
VGGRNEEIINYELEIRNWKLGNRKWKRFGTSRERGKVRSVVGTLDSHGQGGELIDAGKVTCLLEIPLP